MEDVSQELQRWMRKVLELTKSSKIPLGFRKLQNDLFKCKICREIVNPQAIVTECCKAILGGDDCVKSWYLSNPQVKNSPV